MLLSAQGKQRIVFSPQWHAQAQFAGYIVARHMGYYEEAGLQVEIKYPTETKSSLDLMREGKADIITTMLSNAVLQKANQDADLVNVMQTSQHNALCLVRKPGKTDADVQSFSGLRIGLWANKLAILADAMNIIQHLNCRIVPFREGFNLMNYDMVDAISAMEYNELLRMKYSGWDVSNRSVLHLCDQGYDVPEDGVYCQSAFYQEHQKEVAAFVKASKKGWDWCRQHPDKATEIVVSEMRNEFVYSNAVIQRASLDVILKKQELTPGKVPYQLQEKQFDEIVRILEAANLITARPDFNSFIAR